MSHPFSDYLSGPDAKIISTWDIIITPYLSIQLAKASALVNPADSDQSAQQQKLRVIDCGWPKGLFLVSGGQSIADALAKERDCFVTSLVHELKADVWDLPYPLSQATDGLVVRGAYDLEDVWFATQRKDLADWSVAEKFRMSLRQVKQVRRIRQTLEELNVSPPNEWPDALTAVAQLAPERLTRDLVEVANHLL